MFIKCLFLLVLCNFIVADFRTSERCPYPHLENGYPRVKQRGNFVKFTCRARFTLMGSKYATCRNGRWDVPLPLCIKSGCDPLDEVKNAVVQSYHYDAWVLFFCFPGHNLVGSPVLYCDGKQWNGTIPKCVDSTSQPKNSCDFEDPDLCGWKQDEIHDFDWRRLNRRTPSSFLFTGPQYDHTLGKNGNGYYMYIESTSRLTNDTARLISPVYDEKLAIDGCFLFYYHMFGRDIGGLRVYQKPEKLNMLDLLSYRENGTNKYLLFEQWGNQGNFWYTGISSLLNVSDDFQIVIEGIRGVSFTSDIAIDDVAILQGEDCTNIKMAATTPQTKTLVQESCEGRCGTQFEDSLLPGCGCTIMCVINDNCCPDFLDTCEFGSFNNSPDDVDPLVSTTTTIMPMPQTQKLVATSTASPSTTSSTSTSTSTTTSTTSTTTSTTTTTTTRRPTTQTTRRVTLKPIVSPTKLTTTTTNRRVVTTPKPTTQRFKWNMTTTLKVLKTTVTPPSVPKTSYWQHPHFTVKRPLPPKKLVEKAKEQQGTSGVLIVVVVLVVLSVICGVMYIGYMARTERGSAALARLRGRTTRDPEVRYLKSDVDFQDIEDE